MVNVLAISAHFAKACEELVAIASALNNIKIKYKRLGIRYYK